MYKILGTLKGVSVKSKLDERNDVVHFIDIKLEIIEGAEKTQDLISHIKDIMEVSLTSKQPKLDMSKRASGGMPDDNDE